LDEGDFVGGTTTTGVDVVGNVGLADSVVFEGAGEGDDDIRGNPVGYVHTPERLLGIGYSNLRILRKYFRHNNLVRPELFGQFLISLPYNI
jgi:hypothetical protein